LRRAGAPGSGDSNVVLVDGHLERREIEDSKEIATPAKYK